MERNRCTIIGSTGFGLCKASTSTAYLTAFGSAPSAVDAVSPLCFLIAMNVSTAVAAAVLVALVHARRVRPGALRQGPAVAALAVGFALAAAGSSAMPPALLSVAGGVIGGFALVVLSACWLEAFSAQDDVAAVRWQVGAGVALQCAVVLSLLAASLAVSSVASVGCACASAACLAAVRRRVPVAAAPQSAAPAHRADRLGLLRAYVCLFALMGVVGILHETFGGSGSTRVVGGVGMATPLAVATVVALAIVAFSARRPDPTVAFKVCLPAMLAALTALPFMGEEAGTLAGLAAIVCYDALGMAFPLFIFERSRTLGVSAAALSAVQLGGSALFLLAGIGVGSALEALSAARGFSLATLLAFAGLYPLALGLAVVRRTHPQGDAASFAQGVVGAKVSGEMPGAAGGGAASDASDAFAAPAAPAAVSSVPGSFATGAPAPAPAFPPPPSAASVPDPLEPALDRLAARCDLTARERDVLGYLARGRSARFIAQDLVLSENTVWAHIKHVYAKMGVHSRQELMSVAERAASAPSVRD